MAGREIVKAVGERAGRARRARRESRMSQSMKKGKAGEMEEGKGAKRKGMVAVDSEEGTMKRGNQR
jgi:hypothetical protein